MFWFSKLWQILRPTKIDLARMEQAGEDLILAMGRGMARGREKVLEDMARQSRGVPLSQLAFEDDDPDIIDGEAVVVAPVEPPADWRELKALAKERGVQIKGRTKPQLRAAVKRALKKAQV
jgi:hypothetical protein